MGMEFLGLVEENYRKKAQTKYEIKCMEARLHFDLFNCAESRRKYSLLIRHSKKLIDLYYKWGTLSKGIVISEAFEVRDLDNETFEACYIKITSSRQHLMQASSIIDELFQVNQLYNLYKMLEIIFRKKLRAKKNRLAFATNDEPTICKKEPNENSIRLEQLFYLLEGPSVP